jgi:hypothetical protein
MTSPSPEAIAWLLKVVRAGAAGDDPYGVLAALTDLEEQGFRGSLDEALSVEAHVDVERRDDLLRELVDSFTNLEEHERIGAAHQCLDTYWKRKWRSHQHKKGGGHPVGSRERLCWEIFDSKTYMFKNDRRLRQIVTGK